MRNVAQEMRPSALSSTNHFVTLGQRLARFVYPCEQYHPYSITRHRENMEHDMTSAWRLGVRDVDDRSADPGNDPHPCCHQV